MTKDSHVAMRIRQALAAASGDVKTAQRLLLQWCGKDPRLLVELTRAYLPGIVAHALSEHASAKAVPAPTTLSAEGLDMVVGQLGQRIGTATVPVGLTALVEPPTRAKAGRQHEQSLRRLAAAYLHKRLEGR